MQMIGLHKMATRAILSTVTSQIALIMCLIQRRQQTKVHQLDKACFLF